MIMIVLVCSLFSDTKNYLFCLQMSDMGTLSELQFNTDTVYFKYALSCIWFTKVEHLCKLLQIMVRIWVKKGLISTHFITI